MTINGIKKLNYSTEAIRLRPTMYVGPLDDLQLANNFVCAALADAVDTAFIDDSDVANCMEVRIKLFANGATVENRSAIWAMNKKCVRKFAEAYMTDLLCGGYPEPHRHIRNEIHKIEVSILNAFCKRMIVEVCDGKDIWMQEYKYGIPQDGFKRVGVTNCDGIRFDFELDESLIKYIQFDQNVIESWIRKFVPESKLKVIFE